MSIVIPPGRWDDSDPVQPLRDAARRIPSAPSDEHLFEAVAGLGAQTARELVSLLHRAEIAFAVPAPRDSHRGAADALAAEGLPSYMSVGETTGPPAEPWWNCSKCRHTRRNLNDMGHAHMCAADHVAHYHSGGAS